MRFGWSLFDSAISEALRKVRNAIQKVVLNLKHNGVRSLLDHHLHEINPTAIDQLRLLPTLELRIGDDLTVKYKMVLRTFTRPDKVGRKRDFDVERVAE